MGAVADHFKPSGCSEPQAGVPSGAEWPAQSSLLQHFRSALWSFERVDGAAEGRKFELGLPCGKFLRGERTDHACVGVSV